MKKRQIDSVGRKESVDRMAEITYNSICEKLGFDMLILISHLRVIQRMATGKALLGV